MPTLAERIAEVLKAHGTERVFGIPGGGSSLDIIDACDRAGIPFVLTRTEAAATIMAAVTGEMTGKPGAALVGVGPGASSAVNGIAYAHIERSPMVLFIDGPASSLHQHFDQQAVYAPIAVGTARLLPEDGAETLDTLLTKTVSAPEGPAVVELTAPDAAHEASAACAPEPHPQAATDTTAIQERLATTRRPLAIIGLEARRHWKGVRKFVERTGIPAVATYKAGGTIAASSPNYIGPVTGAQAENALYADADLIIGIGFDPVEFIPGTWPETAPPLVMLNEADIDNPRIPAAARAHGSLPEMLSGIGDAIRSEWGAEEFTAKRQILRDIYAPRGTQFSCADAIDAVMSASGPGTRLACDAGAHMFATLGLWKPDMPVGVLKSNGLSTMGYALPAAIAAALQDPDTPVIAVTGDGGLSMCLGELATVKDLGLDITVIVINDAALSLIDIKQQRQQRPSRGVRYLPVDYAEVARAFGWTAATVLNAEELGTAMSEAGPKLIDVRIDPAGYGEDMVRLRG